MGVTGIRGAALGAVLVAVAWVLSGCGDDRLIGVANWAQFKAERPERPARADCVDADGDGFGDGLGCDGPDCDDNDPLIGGSARRNCYTGPAGTEGVGACRGGVQTCAAGLWTACTGEALPSAESCDGIDNDCNGSVDEQLTRTCYSGPSGTDGVGACHAGVSTCSAGVFGACVGEAVPVAETCDGVDNDCNGAVDEQVTRSCYSGPSGTDGVGACHGGVQTCVAGAFGACVGEALPLAETCDGVDNDCNGAVDENLIRSCYSGPAGTDGVGACHAGVSTCSNGVFGACVGEQGPAAIETCDGVDNDCDGAVDENVTRSCYSGPAGTNGVGACHAGVQTCSAGVFGACVGEQVPAATEICDGIDNDCDGSVDENVTRACYSGPAGTNGVGACHGGVQTCSAGVFGACVGEQLPATSETCDGVDNDCDGAVDEQVTRSCYSGPAGTDGVGACHAGVQTCSAGVFGACVGEQLPAAKETCDGIDNNCDGAVDEEVTRSCYSGPAGTDGVGACHGGVQTCVAGAFGACVGEALPATSETCDGIDNDCDGSVDEQVTRSCYSGPAGTDGIGACHAGVQTCTAGSFGACVGEALPEASETCDGIDNDCDGRVDEEVTRACYLGPSATEGVGACHAGTQTCSAGAFGPCMGQVLPRAESCDAVDNDCNGQVDDGLVQHCYAGPAGTEDVGVCHGGTSTCVAGKWGQCAGQVLQSQEICNGLDDDCDGQVDESLVRGCYSGPGQTSGVGICRAGSQSCSAGAWGTCGGETLPASEQCDGLDNNCNGSTDENVSRQTYDGASQAQDPVYRPIDIVLVVDNSGSMTEEIQAVEGNINSSFASILSTSGLDYRVILLSHHGAAATDQSICIRPPLSGNKNCAQACPVNGPRFFQYSVEIGSHDALSRIVTTYNAPDTCGLAPKGWSQWLRPGAARLFMVITDDGPQFARNGNINADSYTADFFESKLFALSPKAFGSATARDYVFHSIVGLHENTPVLAPWKATDPLVTPLCTGAGGNVVQNGLEYQKLSQRTDGLRYPICQYASFDSVFREVASKIISGSQMACDFRLSSIPADSSVDNTLVDFIPTNGGARTRFKHVADVSACSGDGFYVSGDVVHLCPDACQMWRSDPTAKIEVVFTCQKQ